MTRIRDIARLVFVLAIAGGMLVACGDDDSSTASGDDSGSNTTEATSDAADVSIEMAEYSYKVSGDLPTGGTLRLRNAGKQFHMLGIGKLKAGKTTKDALAAIESESEEDDAATVEEISLPGSFVGPGQEADITAPSLGAGDYVLLCFINVEGEETPHFQKGMVGELKVTDEKADPPTADAVYTAAPGKAITGPATLKAGHHVLEVKHDGNGSQLEPGIFRLNDGTTVEQFAEAIKVFDEGPLPKDAAAKLPGDMVIAAHDFASDTAVYFGVDLEPGTYVIAAQDSDVENAPALPVERIEIKVT